MNAIAARRGMPTLNTLCRRLGEDSSFRARYENAHAARSEMCAADVVALADALAGRDRAGLKFRLDARKWRVAVMRKVGGGKNDAGSRGIPDELEERLEEAHRRIAEEAARAAAVAKATETETRDERFASKDDSETTRYAADDGEG